MIDILQDLIYCFTFFFRRRPIQHLCFFPTGNIQMLNGTTAENKGKTIN